MIRSMSDRRYGHIVRTAKDGCAKSGATCLMHDPALSLAKTEKLEAYLDQHLSEYEVIPFSGRDGDGEFTAFHVVGINLPTAWRCFVLAAIAYVQMDEAENAERAMVSLRAQADAMRLELMDQDGVVLDTFDEILISAKELA